MVKKGKKFLALTLSVSTLFHCLGNFGILAMDPPSDAAVTDLIRIAKRYSPLELYALRCQEIAGITARDLEKFEIKLAFEVCEHLISQHPRYEKCGKNFAEQGKDCKFLSDVFRRNVDHYLRTHSGDNVTFVNQIIYEILIRAKRAGKCVKIYPLVMSFCDGGHHIACMFISGYKRYIIDPTFTFLPPDESVCRCVYTLESFLKFYNSQKKIKRCSILLEDISTCKKPLKDVREIRLDPDTGTGISGDDEEDITISPERTKNVLYSILVGLDGFSKTPGAGLRLVSIDVFKEFLKAHKKIFWVEKEMKECTPEVYGGQWIFLLENFRKNGYKLSKKDAHWVIEHYFEGCEIN